MSDAGRFFSKRPKALKFEDIGDSYTLHITEDVAMDQQTDYDDGTPLWWDDEKTRPKEQAILVGFIKKGLTGPDDDGERSLYIKGYMQSAVTEALREAKAKVPGPGGVITVTYDHDGPQTDRKKKPPKMFTAAYVPSSKASGEKFFGDEDGEEKKKGKEKASVGASGANSEEDPPF